MSQLQEYVDSQVATISPFKIKSQELLEQAKAKEVTDDATAKEAVAIRKLITSHRTEVKNARLAIARNLAREEAARVEAICAKFEVNAKSLRSQKACDEKGAELKQIFAELPEADQNHAEIKLAFTKAINSLLTRKDELTNAERDAAEQAKIEAQRKREQEIAEAEAAKAAKAQKPAVKSGIKTKTVFTVINPELVPRSLCEPSDKLIREAIANGLREIPGVEVREEKSF